MQWYVVAEGEYNKLKCNFIKIELQLQSGYLLAAPCMNTQNSDKNDLY